LISLPIAWRLALGFVLAAGIAAAAAGVAGSRQAEALAGQAQFYQHLLASTTQLTEGDTFLLLMNSELDITVADASAPSPSSETLTGDQSALQGLEDSINRILSSYAASQLIARDSSEVSILDQAGQPILASEQQTLLASVERAWQVYENAEAEVVQAIQGGDVTGASTLLRAQAQPTNSDAHSAMNALVQFNARVAAAVEGAATVEQRSLIITAVIAVLLAVMGIGLVGWIISQSLVRRLSELHRVTRTVEEGDLETRVAVVGRDEIARVSASVNGMLNAIVGLLDVTRRQRDALVNAAERLFADVRVAGAGDLSLNATVGGDPIGMLANAFNLTIGRFRRYVLRTQSAQEQLDVLARQEYDHAEEYLRTFLVASSPPSSHPVVAAPWQGERGPSPPVQAQLSAALERTRALVRSAPETQVSEVWHRAQEYAEQTYLSAGRLSQLTLAASVALRSRSAPDIEQALRGQMQELRTTGSLLEALAALARDGQEHAMADRAKLHEALDYMAGVVQGFVQLPATSTPVGRTVASMPYEELAQHGAACAQELADYAQRFLRIAQEMRTSAAPFARYPAPLDSNLYPPGLEQETHLYAPLAYNARPHMSTGWNDALAPRS
jgi:methyl-accepting chemotaxis protein